MLRAPRKGVFITYLLSLHASYRWVNYRESEGRNTTVSLNAWALSGRFSSWRAFDCSENISLGHSLWLCLNYKKTWTGLFIMETWRSLWLRINFQSSATSVEESCKETQAAVLSGCFMHAWLLRKLRLWEIPLGHRAYFSIFVLSLPHMNPPPPVILFLSHPLWLNS